MDREQGPDSSPVLLHGPHHLTYTVGRPSVGRTELRLCGELDIASAQVVDSVVRQLVGGGWLLVVVDLGELSFADCAGLASLVGSVRVAEEAGGRLLLTDPCPQVARVLRWSGLDALLEVGDRPPDVDRLPRWRRRSGPAAPGHETVPAAGAGRRNGASVAEARMASTSDADIGRA